MKQTKAFTIIEMLAIIVILGITLIIVLPNIIGISDREKQNKYDKVLNSIYLAAETYLTNEDEVSYPEVVQLQTLIDEGYIDGPLTNPITETELEYDKYVSITKGTDNKLEFLYPGNLDSSGASAPDITSNMFPVYWDATSSVWRKADRTNTDPDYKWYDYDAKMWANVVTTSSTNRATYQTADLGTIISDADILTFHVWIPRYRYLIPAGTDAREIRIIFESKTTTKSLGNAITNYLTHPAFTFNSVELSGIWSGKFDVGYAGATTKNSAEQNVTTANKVIIRPNSYSWRSIQLANAFTVSRSMEDVGNMYGFTASEVDTHMVTGTEWGAVAYLSRTVYGKNEEVWLNANISYLTGCSSGAATIAASSACFTYNTTNGFESSTTGNIYGIYDMSGGAWNLSMGNYNSYSGYSVALNSYFNGPTGWDSGTFSGGIAFPSSKYYNTYTTSVSATACGGATCYGQAMSETYNWYGGGYNMVSSSYPWLVRGGSAVDGTYSGIFAHSGYHGATQENIGFGITLLVGTGL